MTTLGIGPKSRAGTDLGEEEEEEAEEEEATVGTLIVGPTVSCEDRDQVDRWLAHCRTPCLTAFILYLFRALEASPVRLVYLILVVAIVSIKLW